MVRDELFSDKKNLNMQGAFLHIITDAVGSIIVIITAFIALMWPDLLGGLFALYLDPLLRFVSLDNRTTEIENNKSRDHGSGISWFQILDSRDEYN